MLIHLIKLLKKCFLALKAEVDKLDINELVKVPTGMNGLRAKLDDLNLRKLKTAPIDI